MIQVCHEPGKKAPARICIQAPYVANADSGRLEPVLPKLCPKGMWGAQECLVTIHSWHGRSTGPCFPLAVITCKTHGGFITVYPPGFVRYLRKPFWRLAPDGGPLFTEQQVDSTSESRLEAARGTLFDAALDAAAHKAWPRQSDGASELWWQTQRRHLEKVMRLTGVADDLDQRTVELLVGTLRVPVMDIMEARASIRAAPGYETRGAAVLRILHSTCGGCGCVAKRLAMAGHIAGLWDMPHWVDRQPTRVKSRPFQQAGMTGASSLTSQPDRINELET